MNIITEPRFDLHGILALADCEPLAIDASYVCIMCALGESEGEIPCVKMELYYIYIYIA